MDDDISWTRRTHFFIEGENKVVSLMQRSMVNLIDTGSRDTCPNTYCGN